MSKKNKPANDKSEDQKVIENTTTVNRKDYRNLKELFVNDKCLPIVEFFIENPTNFYTRAQILDETTIDKGTLNRYLPVLSKSKYDILVDKKHTFEGKRNNTTIYAINMNNPINHVILQLISEIRKYNKKP